MIGIIDTGLILAWLIVLAILLFTLCLFCIQYGKNMRLEEELRNRDRKGKQ